MLARLPSLQSIDFMNQFLTGTLPPDVAFPSLQVLQLAENYISVRAAASPFPMAVHHGHEPQLILQLSRHLLCSMHCLQCKWGVLGHLQSSPACACVL